jgi:hypothetical protein
MMNLLVLLCVIGIATSFRFSVQPLRLARITSSIRVTDDSGASSEKGATNTPVNPEIEEIRAKCAADPNYDFMKDPKALKLIEENMPDSLKQFSQAVGRLKQVIIDGTTGQDAPSLEELEKFFQNMEAANYFM